MRRARRLLGWTLLAAAAGVIPVGGCAQQRDEAAVVRSAAPPYAEVAAQFNQRVERLGRVWGQATVQIRYNDADGDRRWEQGEGFLTLQRPDRVALSVGKLGETLFWLGGDGERYWWLDLSSKPKRATSGRYDGPARRGGLSTRLGGLAATISPKDLFALLAIEPLPTEGGVSRWSADGRWLGLETAWAGTGRRVVWVIPGTLEAQKVELFSDASGPAVLSAVLTVYEPVDQVGDSRIRPQVPGRAVITHTESGTELRLALSGLDNQPRRFPPAAFKLEEIIKTFPVDEAVDLDVAATRQTEAAAARARAARSGSGFTPAHGPEREP
jgi:hypothetical protein